MFKNKEYTYIGKIGTLHLVIGGTLVLFMLSLAADYTGGQMLAYCGVGAILLVFGIFELKRYRKEREAHDMDFSAGFEVNAEGSAVQDDPALAGFRQDYAKFFAEDGISENSAVQSDTTQLFKNVLDLQKKRLDKLGIKMEFRSTRKQYTENGVRKDSFFDGKYEITDVDEEIEAKRRYTEDGLKIFLRTSNQVAHYTMLDAKRVGNADTIVCPNCGNETTRENLIDGCDYCGTKFTVEDLGQKVSSFSFRDRFEIAYAKFKSLRGEYALNAILGGFVVIYFLIFFAVLLILTDEAGNGYVLNPVIATLSMLVCGGTFAALFDVIWTAFYVAVIMPLLNIGASFKYNSKRKLQALHDAEEADKAFAERVRKTDPLFSAADFVSNVQNKLACVIFADTPAQANTFSDFNLSSKLPDFENVFDFDIDRIEFKDFRVADGLQQMCLDAHVQLFSYDGKKVRNRKVRISMNLVKSANCKTQAVCAPSIMKCKGCGNSLSLANGLVCSYCGSRVDLKEYDWVISSFKSRG